MKTIKTNLEFNSNKTKRAIESIKRIILHNSGVTVLQSIEVIHNYHKNTRGYAGIGYHFYIRKDGTIYEGRPVEYVGAHAGNNNSDSIGICFEGDYNQETMPEAQIKAGQELVAYLKAKYNINKVQKHSEVCNTSCPGKNFPFEQIVNVQTSSENVSKNEIKQDNVNDVRKLQTALNKVYKANLAVDGIIGKNTRNALRKVALKNYCANELVKFVQERLIAKGYNVGNTKVDGKYGKNTANAVRQFQKANGLAVDGIAGINTISKLV